jgi:anti-sigma B factor antagonist
MNLDMSVHEHPDLVEIVLAGELDFPSTPEFQRAVAECCDPEAVQLVIDLSAVDLIDSSGLGALLGLARKTAAGGRRLALVSGEGAMLRRLLAIAQVEEAFLLAESLEEVREALGRTRGAAPAEGG